MAAYSYEMSPITNKRWTKEEKDFINSKRDVISQTISEMVRERTRDGFPLTFCEEAVRRFEQSIKKKDNKETQAWLQNFTDRTEDDRLHIKRLFDKKLYDTVNFICNNEFNAKEKKQYHELTNGTELEAEIEANRTNLKTMRDYASILSEDVSWKCFIQYRDKHTAEYCKNTGRKVDESIANERALDDMYQFIEQTTDSMNNTCKKKKDTEYSFYMGADTEKILDAIKNTRKTLTEQGFDDELITNTENHMKSILSEGKYNIYKNYYAAYDTEQAVSLAMYEDMNRSINNCYLGKSHELSDYVNDTHNMKKFPAYQAQLLVNVKKIKEPEPVSNEKSQFTQFDNVASFEEQTTYRMKLMREKDRTDKKQFNFYTYNTTDKMAESALKVQDCLGKWSNCTELTKTALPKMPAVHEYDGDKVMFVSKKSWDSYMKHTDGDCYATVENFQICDMNRIVIVDKDCSTKVFEPQIETIEGKKYWKGFKEDKTLALEQEEQKNTEIEPPQQDITEKDTVTEVQENVEGAPPVLTDEQWNELYANFVEVLPEEQSEKQSEEQYDPSNVDYGIPEGLL